MPNDILYVKIGTISITFHVPLGLKSLAVNMNRSFFTPFRMRIPHRFPGIILKGPGNVSCSVFNGGKAIACGFKRLGQIQLFLDTFRNLFETIIKLNSHEL
jgi:TATA-box binding protein (TBP) (component of TFIID and TFIIIB)